MKTLMTILVAGFALTLAGCGTYEVGYEPVSVPETRVHIYASDYPYDYGYPGYPYVYGGYSTNYNRGYYRKKTVTVGPKRQHVEKTHNHVDNPYR